jgi:peroxiredoxin
MADDHARPHGDSGVHEHPPATPRTLAVGEPVPHLVLPDLDGTLVDLADLRRSTLVLFWNLDCGFCHQLLPELLGWEADPPPHAPALLLVSNGTVEANQALGLDAPIVLDHELEVGWSFGVTGTPSGVLVDADGRIASELAVGAPAIRALVEVSRDRVHSAAI